MRISDWSSDVCSSDLVRIARGDRRKRVRSRIDALIGAEHDAGAAVADVDPTIDDHDERAITITTHREASAEHAHLAVAGLDRDGVSGGAVGSAWVREKVWPSVEVA